MNCIRYRDGYKYQLRAPYAVRLPELADPGRAPIATDWIELDPDGSLRVSAGYAWDGASGPTYDSKCSMRGSLVHDALYQLMRLQLLDRLMHRETADAVFHRICREDGMWSWRAAGWHWAVRTFASPASDPRLATPDHFAPDGCDCAATPIDHGAALDA